jgi:predicted aldo/keto reductase-like oxidoreductase
MRFPEKEEKVTRLIRHAIDKGVNYLDTAYVYKGNEVLIGKALFGVERYYPQADNTKDWW